MFEQGCILAAKTGHRFSINVSDCELSNEGLFDFINTTMEKYAVDPRLLSLEILEYNAISHSVDIKEMLIKIHLLGIDLIVDDFGVQCSNFGQIEHLPISTLKIDGSFIQNIDESVNSQIVVKTIQTFAHEKGLKLIAEFVCNEKVFEKVKELGIEYIQGYYLSQPAPFDV
jgi:EAL domain-containing protein (putative c-di-GMP-specific phosphodiesterase class I)